MMRFDELPFEVSAMKGERFETISDLDALLFSAAKTIYALYQRNSASKQEAKEIITALRCLYWYKQRATEIQRRNGKFWQKMESVITEYVFDSTVANADKIVSSIYNLGEDWRKEPLNV